MSEQEHIENLDFDDWHAEKMKDPEFRAAYEALDPAYQIIKLRLQRSRGPSRRRRQRHLRARLVLS